MSESWYYVEKGERKGPVSKEDLLHKIQYKELNKSSYVWSKGFENWQKVADVAELQVPKGEFKLPGKGVAQAVSTPEVSVNLNSSMDENSSLTLEGEEKKEDSGNKIIFKKIKWNELNPEIKKIMIKVGHDRNSDEREYGPFSINQLKKLRAENRINAKTFIFCSGMENWQMLGELDLDQILVGRDTSSEISEDDKRIHVRKPFVAKLYFHDDEEFYEGVCRDISIGGLQVLVSDFPGEAGDTIKMNVHPSNTDHHFLATGVIVRKLEGNQGFSLRFNQLEPQALKSIQAYLDESED